MRLEFYEERRQKIIQQLRNERQRIMQEEQNGQWSANDYQEDGAFLTAFDGARSIKSGKSGRKGRACSAMAFFLASFFSAFFDLFDSLNVLIF